jgi:ribosomal protein L29
MFETIRVCKLADNRRDEIVELEAEIADIRSMQARGWQKAVAALETDLQDLKDELADLTAEAPRLFGR